MSRSGRDAALRILHLLFADAVGADTHRPEVGVTSRVSLTGFQREGVERVHRVLIRRGGAILADSVGLGKTYMALAIVEETLRTGGDAVVVVPASVRSMWRRALRSLDGVGTGCRVVSHTGLARGLVPLEPSRGVAGDRSGARPAERLVVIDEAHRFRNPRTMRYAALARLLGVRPGEGTTRALLLTATPINNRAEDLFHLIRLFARDDAFRDVGVPSLRDAFGIETSRDGPAQDRVAAVVRSVVVRRTRDMVSARFGEPEPPFRFPRRAPPRLVRYHDPALRRSVAQLSSLNLAVYALSNGACPSDSPVEPAGLILINLLKRLDSSPAAFGASVLRLGKLTRASLDAAVAGRILAPARGGAGGARDDGDPLQLTLVELVAGAAAPDTDMPALIESLRSDLDTLQCLERLRQGRGRDPKLGALLTLLDRLDGERAIVFTEYRDTAAYLERSLVRRHRVGRVDGGGAWLGGRPAGRRSVVEAFAPRANGRDGVPDRERVDVLVATDVLAEGVNLQDARHLVSYDLPWNPVRLLQRIGRVDRLGSPHAEVASYLFVPGTGLEAMLGLMRRLRQKLDHITTIVGGEQADELLAGLAQPTTAVGELGAEAIPPRALERIEAREGDAMEALRTLWIRERDRSHPLPATSPQTAPVSVGPEDPAAALAWVALVQDAAGTTLLEVDREKIVRPAGARSVAVVGQALGGVCGSARRPRAADEAVPDPPLEALRSHRAPAIAALRAPGPLPPHDPAALLARRLRKLAGDAGVALDRRAIDRIDRVLDQLTAPLHPVIQERIRSVLDDETLNLESLLDVTERALGDGRNRSRKGGAAAVEVPRDIQVLAALHIRVDRDLTAG